jgi:hypothetical protein
LYQCACQSSAVAFTSHCPFPHPPQLKMSEKNEKGKKQQSSITEAALHKEEIGYDPPGDEPRLH